MESTRLPQQPRLVLYGRSGCHLCEDMEQDLTSFRASLGFSVEYRDVDSNDDWRRRFGDLVPILFFGDTEVSRYFLDPTALRRAVSGALPE